MGTQAHRFEAREVDDGVEPGKEAQRLESARGSGGEETLHALVGDKHLLQLLLVNQVSLRAEAREGGATPTRGIVRALQNVTRPAAAGLASSATRSSTASDELTRLSTITTDAPASSRHSTVWLPM